MDISGSTRVRFVLLAPFRARVPEEFRQVTTSRVRYEKLLAQMQMLRANVYLADGAIAPSQVTRDGRHCQPADDQSWHLLSVDAEGTVRGCVRYLPHGSAARFEDLTVRHAALAQADQWAGRLRAAVESEMELARCRSVAYIEVGGWAIAPERRCTADAFRVALAGYGIGRLLGGCVGITTATTRHCSSSILRRIGGRSLDYGGPLPPYWDPQYGCQMELLRFDSTAPDPRYENWVEQLNYSLLDAPVVCRQRHAPEQAAEPDSVPAWVTVAEPLAEAV